MADSSTYNDFHSNKQELFKLLLKKKGINISGTQAIPRVGKKDCYELSFAQQRLWFLAQLEPDSTFYNIPAAFRLEGKLNVEALHKSFNEIIRRHEALRTNFRTIEGQAVAVILEDVPLTLSILDISSLSAFQQEAEVKQQAAQEAKQPFDISSDYLLRVKILRVGEQEYIVLLTMHHIVSDGWSVGVLVQEFSSLYSNFCNQEPISYPELPIQYVDFAAWQRQWLQGEVIETQKSYWLKQLENTPKVLELPTDHPRPAIQTYRGANYSFKLSQELSAALNKLSQQQGTTLFMTLLAGFQTLLWRYTAQEDIVVGSPIANRNRAEIEGLIGFFLNTLVLRTNLAGNPSFEELLKQVREVSLGAYAHQDLPFELLVEQLKVERSLSHAPLFQVMFVLQNAPMSALELPDLTLTPLEGESRTAKFDLTLQMTETESGLVGNLEYNIDLFEESSIQRMAAHLQVLLEGIVANPQQRLSELPFLTESEQHQLLVEWNNTEVDYPPLCIHELFEAQVEKTPDAVAVVFEDQQLTYCELNSKANQLAHHLRSLGVKPEALVGICVERSLDMVIGLLAILKAGGAYVPLDPMYPLERLTFMLEDADIFVLLTHRGLTESFSHYKGHMICLDADWQTIAQYSQKNHLSGVTPNNLMYAIYTSGSTGRPKGARVYQRSFTNLLNWFVTEFKFNCNDRVLLISSLSFDLTQKNIYAPLIVGGELHLFSSENYDAAQIVQSVCEKQVTWLNCTPSAFYPLIDHGDKSLCMKKTLRYVFLGGEPISISRLKVWLDSVPCKTEIVNTYGPTECTDICAAYRVTQPEQLLETAVPIGKPIYNAKVYVLDQNLEPLPARIVGELYVGGEGVGRGYINNLDLTLAKFVCDPFSAKPGAWLYKTGDLARYLPNGEIEFIGRIDHQVKLRGFRIELAEIEAIITQHPAVRETVVVVREDSVDFQRIVAYVVAHLEQTLTITELREFLESKLPNYMVPAAFVTLEALPLTPNGKVDRKALPVPKLTQVSSSNIVPASTLIENLLAGIWTKVLGIEKVGINNNFFDLGGHSLIATRVISQIRQVFQVDLPLRCLFEKPTIAGLAKEIEKASQAGYKLEVPAIKRIKRATELPLSFAQQRLWFLTQLKPKSSSYNITEAVQLQGELNHNALEQSFNEIVCRHEALRTNFQTRGGEAVAVISEDLLLMLPIFDISELSVNQKQAVIKQQISQEAQQPFDLSRDNLLRFKLLRLGEREHIVLLTIHHIVSDGWSTGLLIEELAALYPAFCQRKSSPLAELPIQYVDFAVWQRQWLQGKVLQTQLDYWRQKLGNTHPRLAFPKPLKPSSTESNQGAKQSFTLSKDLTEAINLLSRKQGVTLFMTLLAVFQVLLHHFTGNEDIRIGTPIANRNRVEIEKLIGFFVNILVLRIDLSGNPSFQELLLRSRQVALEAYAHQDLPFEKLVEELQPERNINHHPLYQACFVLQNAPMSQLELPDLTLTSFEVDRDTVRHDLLLAIWESSEGLRGKFEYKTDLFYEASISRLIEHFKKLIQHIVAQPNTRLNEMVTILTQSNEDQQRVQKQELRVTERQKLKMIKRKTIRK